MRYKVENLNTRMLETELNCQAAGGFELVQVLGVGTDKTKVILKNPSLPPIEPESEQLTDEQKEKNNG